MIIDVHLPVVWSFAIGEQCLEVAKHKQGILGPGNGDIHPFFAGNKPYLALVISPHACHDHDVSLLSLECVNRAHFQSLLNLLTVLSFFDL